MLTSTIPLQHPVEKNPNILGGTPVIKGTRIPAKLVSDLLKLGYPRRLIVSEYPSLTLYKVNLFSKLISQKKYAAYKTV